MLKATGRSAVNVLGLLLIVGLHDFYDLACHVACRFNAISTNGPAFRQVSSLEPPILKFIGLSDVPVAVVALVDRNVIAFVDWASGALRAGNGGQNAVRRAALAVPPPGWVDRFKPTSGQNSPLL